MPEVETHHMGHYTYPSWMIDTSHHHPEQHLPSQGSSSIIQNINYIVNVYIDGILCFFGFVGNFCIIVLLQRDKCKTSNSFLMQVLAIYDILLLLFTLLYTTLRSVYPATGHLQWYHDHSPYIIAYILPFGWMAQTGNNWITTALAGDRYLAISKPFKAVRWCTMGNAKRLVIILSAINFLFNFPRFIHYHLVAFHADSNWTFVSHIKFNMSGWNSDVYHYVYHTTLTCIFLFILPLSSLLFFKLRLVSTLRASTGRRAQLTANGNQKRNSALEMSRTNFHITLNVVVLITKFIICQLPDFVLAILGAFGAFHEVFSILSVFAQMLLVFNSSANFYVYLIFNHKFRNVFSKKWQCCSASCQYCDRAALELHPRSSIYSVGTTKCTSKASVDQDDATVTLTSVPLGHTKSNGSEEPLSTIPETSGDT